MRAGSERAPERSIIYRADLARFREVTLFLMQDCCGGHPEACATLLAELVPGLPEKASKA
jgi:ArsR family transcriptional regulator, arsenate/arsenite/antimonite-responsive transcriptional repressor